MCFIRLLGLLFQHLTPPVGGPLQIFERSVFERTTYRAKTHPERTQLQQKITFGISGSGSINQGNTYSSQLTIALTHNYVNSQLSELTVKLSNNKGNIYSS